MNQPTEPVPTPFSGHIPKANSVARGVFYGFVAVMTAIAFGGTVMVGGLGLVAHRVGISGLAQIADYVMTPPTNDKLFTILSKGIGVTESILRTNTVGSTPDAAFATDLTAGQQSDAFTQEILIMNRDTHTPAQNLCVASIAWSSPGGGTCALKCAAATITCSGAATDGFPIGAGTVFPRQLDGTNCVCLVASAASTLYTDERVVR